MASFSMSSSRGRLTWFLYSLTSPAKATIPLPVSLVPSTAAIPVPAIAPAAIPAVAPCSHTLLDVATSRSLGVAFSPRNMFSSSPSLRVVISSRIASEASWGISVATAIASPEPPVDNLPKSVFPDLDFMTSPSFPRPNIVSNLSTTVVPYVTDTI